MLYRASRILSYLFHPIFLPGLIIILLKLVLPIPLFYSFLPQKLFVALLFFVIGYTTIIPLSFVYFLKRLGMINDIELSKQQDRPKVYLFTSGFFIALAYFLYHRGSLFTPTSVIIIAMTVNILGLFIFSYFDKISVHAAGLAGMAGIFLALFTIYRDTKLVPVFLSILVIYGLVSSARLYLGNHNLKQIITGSAWGLISCFTIVFYFIKIA